MIRQHRVFRNLCDHTGPVFHQLCFNAVEARIIIGADDRSSLHLALFRHGNRTVDMRFHQTVDICRVRISGNTAVDISCCLVIAAVCARKYGNCQFIEIRLSFLPDILLFQIRKHNHVVAGRNIVERVPAVLICEDRGNRISHNIRCRNAFILLIHCGQFHPDVFQERIRGVAEGVSPVLIHVHECIAGDGALYYSDINFQGIHQRSAGHSRKIIEILVSTLLGFAFGSLDEYRFLTLSCGRTQGYLHMYIGFACHVTQRNIEELAELVRIVGAILWQVVQIIGKGILRILNVGFLLRLLNSACSVRRIRPE